MIKTLFTNLLLLIVMMIAGTNGAWADTFAQIDLRGTTDAIVFSAPGTSLRNSYGNDADATFAATNGNSYSGWVLTNCMKGKSNSLQIKVGSSVVSPTILSDNGFKVEVTYTESATGSQFKIDGEQVDAKENSSTSATFTLSTGYRVIYISEIKITPLTVSDPTDARLSFKEAEQNWTFETTYPAPELNNPLNLAVTYSSSNENVAIVDENSGEVLTGSIEGSTVITAALTTAGNYTKHTSASYTINVAEGTKTVIDLRGKTSSLTFEYAGVGLSGAYATSDNTNYIVTADDGKSYSGWNMYQCIKGTGDHANWIQMNPEKGSKFTLPVIKSNYGFKLTVAAVDKDGNVDVKMNNVVCREYISNAKEAMVQIETATTHAVYISTITITPLPAPVVLSDASDYSPVAATGVNVELNRKMVAGWNGVTLPFAISEDVQNALGASEVKTLDTAVEENGGITLNFVDATLPVAAGTPVLVKLDEAKESAFIPNVDIEAAAPTTVAQTAADNTFTLTGNYASTALDAQEVYFVAGNSFNHKAAGVALNAKPFRAYIVQTTAAGSQARTVRFNMGDSETTGIREMAAERNHQNETFNLQGQRVSRTAKGVYIVNGKKTIVK